MGTDEPFSQSIVAEDASDETPKSSQIREWYKNNESRLRINAPVDVFVAVW
jgi:hypothetical protein